MDAQATPLTHKFIAVLNKKIPVARLLNALGHMTAGVAGSYPDKIGLRLDNYYDKNGGIHPSISDLPFIILQADNSNQIRTLRHALQATGIHYIDFTSTMVGGGYEEQKLNTKNTPELELEYFGICMFGTTEQLSTLTKKFSLWRSDAS